MNTYHISSSKNSIKAGNAYDLLKFIMSLLIVSIHSYGFDGEWFKYWVRPLNVVAVPVFFMLSSLFYFRKIRREGKKASFLTGFLRRLGLLYVFWFIINIPIIQHTKQYFVSGVLVDEIKRFGIDFIINGAYSGAWFFCSLAFCVTILTMASNNRIIRNLILFISMLFLMYVYWVNFIPEEFKGLHIWWQTNMGNNLNLSPFEGLPWVSLGYCLSSDKVNKLMERIMKCSALILPSFIILLCLVYLINCNYGIYALNLPFLVVISCSLVVMAGSSRLTPKPIFLKMRKLSVLFFMIHFIFLWCAGVIVKKIWGYERLCDCVGYLPSFFITIVFCLIFSCVFLKLSDQNGFRWLKYGF